MESMMQSLLPLDITHTSRDGEVEQSYRRTWLLVLMLVLQAIVGIIVGLSSDIGMIFYMELASNTLDYDKYLYYHQHVPESFIMGLVLSVAVATLCIYSRKTRLISVWILGTAFTFSLGIACYIYLVWFYGGNVHTIIGCTALLTG